MSGPTGDASDADPERGWFGEQDHDPNTRPGAPPRGAAEDWVWSGGVRLPGMREVTAPTDGHARQYGSDSSVDSRSADQPPSAQDGQPPVEPDQPDQPDGASSGPQPNPGQQSPGQHGPSQHGAAEPRPHYGPRDDVRYGGHAGQQDPSGQQQQPYPQQPYPQQPYQQGQPGGRPRFLPGTQILDRGGKPWSWTPSPPGDSSNAPPALHPAWSPNWTWTSGHAPTADPAADLTDGEHQLHWISVPLRTLVSTVVFLALPGLALLGVLGVQRVLAVTLMVFAAAGVYCLAAWWLAWFKLDADHLVVRWGMFRRTVQEVPISRLQAVDVVRPFVAQLLGLAELRIELAGGDRGEVRLRYLSSKTAVRLRDVLLARASGLPPSPDAPPERPFYKAPFGLLLAGLAFRIPVLGAFFLFLLLIVSGVAFFELGVLGGVIPLLLGLVRGFLGPLLRYATFTASFTPDGLRLHHGMFRRRVQTIPPGRVQAVRIVAPTLWRYLGVVRVEANVAGYVGERQMDSSTLLPVADRATAFYLINELFPGTSAESVTLRPAKRSLSKHDALGVDDSMFVTRRGLVGEVVEMVPLARIQSVRLTSDLVSRWLGVATVEADCPPGPVRARAPGRELAEARRTVEAITAGAHAARAATAGPERWATRSDSA